VLAIESYQEQTGFARNVHWRASPALTAVEAYQPLNMSLSV
jgi:hypothetical protein